MVDARQGAHVSTPDIVTFANTFKTTDDDTDRPSCFPVAHLQYHLGNGFEALSEPKRLTYIQYPGDLRAGVQTQNLKWMFRH